MKVLLINAVLGYGSTGKIVLDIAREYDEKGFEVKIAYGRKPEIPAGTEKYAVLIGSKADTYMHGIYTRLTDKHGLGSRHATAKFLKWAEEYDPDILWLHNIHGYYINYEMLFAWIKSRPDMKVKWTLHDCWTFTGHCAYYTYEKCDKWMTCCSECPSLAQYPKSNRDNSKDNYLRKKAAFTGVKNLQIITPSAWLKAEVEKSFLAEYPVEVIYNRINTEVFKPTDSSFRKDHDLADKKMLLGVASIWERRKGLDDYIELSRILDAKAPGRYKIVLVGLNEAQIDDLHKRGINILALPRTSSATKLAEIYSAADAFVNLTHEDNLPTVNLEAEACGTPVITYDTGGCAETIHRQDSVVVPQDIQAVSKIITDVIY